MSDFGRVLMVLGGVLFLIGAWIAFVGKVPLLGRLPGDITIRRDGFTFYFPLATSILVSVILSLLLWLFRR